MFKSLDLNSLDKAGIKYCWNYLKGISQSNFKVPLLSELQATQMILFLPHSEVAESSITF
jgi:hypothetical protein